MNAMKVAALALIVAGVLALAYGGFSYTKQTHQATLGPIELSVKKKQVVDIPVWGGIAAIAIGGLLIVFGGKRS
jgi:TRAP-type C4-dicarboxylate transport system permease small subunit